MTTVPRATILRLTVMGEGVMAEEAGAVAARPAPPSADAFAAWVAPHVGLLTLLAERQVGRTDRDDVVQEALVRAWRRRHTFDPARGEPRSWLCAVLLDQCRRHRMRHPWLDRMRADRLPDRTAPGADPVDGGRIDVERAVARLPRRQRQVVVLHYLADLPVADVATALGIAQGSVKSHLHDARAALRTVLSEGTDDHD